MIEVYKFLGEVVAVGGTTVVLLYGLFKYLGAGWLENKFKESLEKFKNEQRKELETFRLQINTQFNRTSKIHEKEIEILPVAWKMFQVTVGEVEYLTVPVRTYPNLDSISEEELTEILDTSSFQETQKKKILNSENKNKEFYDIAFLHDLGEVKLTFREFHNYIKQNSIFLRPDLKGKFEEADQVLWEAINNQETSHQFRDLQVQRETYSTVRKKIIPIRNEIENLVQKRLSVDQA